MNQIVTIKQLGHQDYTSTWQAMRSFTQTRTDHTTDEIWVVEHPPVFTQGLAGKAEHILQLNQTPLIHSDRGGQVTYHGPGQLVIYPLVNLNRLNLNIRQLVTLLEDTIIQYLCEVGITAYADCKAPGVYIEGKKIASIGLRIRKQCSYHGIAINIKMDLKPFTDIRPCGYDGLYMTQLAEYIPDITVDKAAKDILAGMVKQLGYQEDRQHANH